MALKALVPGICEMKRLYVQPQIRGRSLGKIFAEAAILEARAIGYRAMRLDSLPSMGQAQGLYRTLGFGEIAPYYDSPVTGTVFMEVKLVYTLPPRGLLQRCGHGTGHGTKR